MGKQETNIIDMKALINSSNELTSTNYNWKGKITSIDSATKSLNNLSKEHDGCLDSGIKKLSKLSDKLGRLEIGDKKVKNGIVTAIKAFTAAEQVKQITVANKVLTTAENELLHQKKKNMIGEKYWNLINNNTPGDWCACFVSWCMKKNNVSEDLVKRSSRVKEIYDNSQNSGTFHEVNSKYKPKAGDLIVWQNERSHIGIVEKYNKGVVTTIEGNTENKDYTKSKISRNKYNVNTGYGNCTGFIAPNYKKKK